MQKKVAFHTLGCKLNYSETSTIGRMLREHGFEVVDFGEDADIYVINTCSVTENADKECRQIIRKAKRMAPDSNVVVIGCYAQLKPKEISEIPGVDLVLGANEKFQIADYLFRLQAPGTSLQPFYACGIEEVHSFNSSFSFGDRTRSFLKVQDGCDYTCSYCTIPLARGRSRSDTIEHVVTQANKIAALGVKEVVLTGVNIGDFKEDVRYEIRNTEEEKPKAFLDLIKELDKVEGIERFRISSIEPNLLTNEIIEFAANSKRFMPHFHIPLQSGCNKILKLMRRRYLRALYRERVEFIKKLMPHCCIGVDVITGFPAETEEDFLETYHFINEMEVSYLHVFTYSERAHTDALKIKEAVPVQERQRRNKMLTMLSHKKRRFFYEQHSGTERKVLFESENDGGSIHGFTDNYIKTTAAFDPLLVNRIKRMKLNGVDEQGNVAISEPQNIFASIQ